MCAVDPARLGQGDVIAEPENQAYARIFEDGPRRVAGEVALQRVQQRVAAAAVDRQRLRELLGDEPRLLSADKTVVVATHHLPEDLRCAKLSIMRAAGAA